MGSSVGKRQRERQKFEKGKVKAERKAARRPDDTEPVEPSFTRSEAELIEDLAALHRALGAGEVALEEFEERRDQLRSLLEQAAR